MRRTDSGRSAHTSPTTPGATVAQLVAQQATAAAALARRQADAAARIERERLEQARQMHDELNQVRRPWEQAVADEPFRSAYAGPGADREEQRWAAWGDQFGTTLRDPGRGPDDYE